MSMSTIENLELLEQAEAGYRNAETQLPSAGKQALARRVPHFASSVRFSLAEPTAIQRLHDVSQDLRTVPQLSALLPKVLEGALSLTGADFGNIQFSGYSWQGGPIGSDRPRLAVSSGCVIARPGSFPGLAGTRAADLPERRMRCYAVCGQPYRRRVTHEATEMGRTAALAVAATVLAVAVGNADDIKRHLRMRQM
jgi:hypothetical protein